MPPQVSALISNLVALLLFSVGIFLHTKGITLNGEQQTAASQLLGGLFDSVAGLIIYVRQLHSNTLKAIQAHVADPMAHFVTDPPKAGTLPDKGVYFGPDFSKKLATQAENTMRKIVPMLLITGLLALVSGCTANGGTSTGSIPPAQILTAANQSVAIAETLLNDLHAANVFSQTDWSHIVSVEAGIGAALDAWQQNLGKPGAVQAQAAFEAALPDLLSFVQSGQKTKNKKGG